MQDSPQEPNAHGAESASSPASEAQVAAHDVGSREVATAMRNALKLGLSLMATWAVALGVRFLLPHHLSESEFGQYIWADSTAGLAFVFAGLGINTYIQREVSVRPDHASDFFGGAMVVRGLLMGALLTGVVGYAVRTDPDPQIQLAVFVFGVTQALVVTNESLAALLQASTKVSKLAIANVLTKLVWGAGVISMVLLTKSYPLLALPMLLGEALKSALLWPAARRELGLKMRIDPVATKAVLITCIPFFMNTISYLMGNKLDVTLLKTLAMPNGVPAADALKIAQAEVGLYGGAQNIASLALLLAPLEGWVITPLLTRAVKRDPAEFYQILRRAVEGILVVAVPATLMINLGADVWIWIACGKKYAAAAPILQQLAPSFVFTYAAVLFATALIILNRSWSVTLISFTRLALQPILMHVVIPVTRERWGKGGAGLGDAFIFTFLEFYVATAFMIALGRRAVDARLLGAIGKSVIACAATYALHHALAPIGPARLVVDAAAYTAIAFGLGIVRIADVRWVVQTVRARKRGGAAA
jgi:O-antigen/teichoic acid export membrane protein